MAGRFFLRFCLLFLSRHLPTPRYRRKRSYILRSATGRITGHRRSLPQLSSAAWCPRLLTRAEVKPSIPQRTDLAQIKRDRHTGRPRKARNTKAFRLRQSISSAEIRRKRLSLPTGEVRPSEHNYDYAAGSYMDEPGVRQADRPRHGRGEGGLHPRPVSGSLRRPAYPRVLPYGHRRSIPTPLKSIHLSSAAA